MEKRIIIEVQIEDTEKAEATLKRLFNAAVDGVQNPVALGFQEAKYSIVHQRIEDVKTTKK